MEIPSSQCSTTHQQLKESPAAVSGIGEGVCERPQNCINLTIEAWGGIQKCGLTLNVLNFTGLITLLTTAG